LLSFAKELLIPLLSCACL